jgi:hypothetical protein
MTAGTVSWSVSPGSPPSWGRTGGSKPSRSRELFAPSYEPFNELSPSPFGMRGWRAPGECRAVFRETCGRSPSARRGDLCPSPGGRYAPHLRRVQARRRPVVVPTVPPGWPRSAKVGNLCRAGAPLRSPVKFRSTRDPSFGSEPKHHPMGHQGRGLISFRSATGPHPITAAPSPCPSPSRERGRLGDLNARTSPQ